MTTRCAFVAALLLGTGGAALAEPPPKQMPTPPGMLLERVFAGPLQDTLIQRLRDPQTGAVCYAYTPARVSFQRNEQGVIFYGANAIGSISCMDGGPEPKGVR